MSNEIKERLEHENALYKKLYEKNNQILTLLFKLEEEESKKGNESK